MGQLFVLKKRQLDQINLHKPIRILMKKVPASLKVMCLVFISLSNPLMAKDTQSILASMIPQFEELGLDQVLVQTVVKHNLKNLSLAEIKRRNHSWMGTADLSDFMVAIMTNRASKRLLELQNEKPFVGDIMIMGNQGAVVAMTNKTSHYWYGDEAPFQNLYRKKTGSYYLGEVYYDDQYLSYWVPISVPIKDQHRVIGVMTFEVNLDKVKK